MATLLKLLIIVMALGLAVKHGVPGMLREQLREVAATSPGAPAIPEEAFDLSPYLSVHGLYDLVATLPPSASCC